VANIPTIVAALISALTALVVAIVGLIPNIGLLRRLERVVSILERVDDDATREAMESLRDRIVKRLSPRRIARNRLLAVGIAVLLAPWAMGSILWLALQTDPRIAYPEWVEVALNVATPGGAVLGGAFIIAAVIVSP
jgi:hypothetical protein